MSDKKDTGHFVLTGVDEEGEKQTRTFDTSIDCGWASLMWSAIAFMDIWTKANIKPKRLEAWVEEEEVAVKKDVPPDIRRYRLPGISAESVLFNKIREAIEQGTPNDEGRIYFAIPTPMIDDLGERVSEVKLLHLCHENAADIGHIEVLRNPVGMGYMIRGYVEVKPE